MIQFTYKDKPGLKLEMTGTDTEGRTFSAEKQRDAAKADAL